MVSEVLVQPEQVRVHVAKARKILIVDDDEALAEVLSRRLAQQGYRPITADSGATGLTMARSERPDLIVLDLRLPDTDGFAICEELADSPDTCGIPVLILSGMERPDIIRRSRSAGCCYFVRKPYDPNALLVLIRQAIQESQDDWSE
ncbi:MAG: response regulator [Pirellulales bacterium]|nr:response regulator [Pirellulales bacterium]